MSRIGNKKITIPAGATVEQKDDGFHVSGSKGKLQTPSFAGIDVKIEGNEISVSRQSNAPKVRGFHGLTRALLNNAVIGVSEGFSRTLILQGVGFRAAKKGNGLVLNLGFSHDVNYPIPQDLEVDVPEPTKIVIKGIDKARVGQVASEIRSFRPPEPYKGKGVRYEDERIRRKAGKTGKK